MPQGHVIRICHHMGPKHIVSSRQKCLQEGEKFSFVGCVITLCWVQYLGHTSDELYAARRVLL